MRLGISMGLNTVRSAGGGAPSPTLLDVAQSLGAVLLIDTYTEEAYALSGSDVTSVKNRITDTTVNATGTPQYGATQFNGGPGVAFSGSEQYFIGTESAVYNILKDKNPCTIIATFQADVADAGTFIFGVGRADASNQSTNCFGQSGAGNGRWIVTGRTDAPVGVSALGDVDDVDTDPHILAVIGSGGGSPTMTLQKDGVAVSGINGAAYDPTVGGTDALTPLRWAWGCRPDSVPDSLFDGNSSLVVAFPTALNAGQLATIYGAIQAHHASLASLFALAAIVVPDDVAATALYYDPQGTVAEFVDDYFMPVLDMVTGLSTQRLPTKGAGRCIHLALTNSPHLATAPIAVQSLAQSLPSGSPQSYVLRSTSFGDIWIVSRSSEGLRHGCYEILESQGAIQLGPHPGWLNVPSVQVPRLNMGNDASVRSPAMGYVAFVGNGGLQAPNAIPGRQESADYWHEFVTKGRYAQEYLKGAVGVAGGGFLKRYQCQIREDRSWLAWDPANAQRGFASNSFPDFPTTCFDSDSFRIQKMCGTHNGTVSGGEYPALSGGDMPWVGISRQEAGCTEGGPECVEVPADPNDDNPDTPLHDDLTTWDGGIAARGEYTFALACETIQANGDEHPSSQLVQVANPDGGANCLCNKCKDLLRTYYDDENRPDATRADQDHFRVKRLAEYVAYRFQNSRAVQGAIGGRANPLLLQRAYSEVIDPPTIPLPSNLLVRLVVDATGPYSSRTKEELFDDWLVRAKTDGFRLGVTPSWGLSNAPAFDLPLYSAEYTLSRMRDWIDRGIRDCNMETSYGNCAYGWLFWCITQMNWGDSRAWEVILDDYFELSYGPIQEPVRRMYDRYWRGVQWSYSVASQAWADLDEAQDTLDGLGNPAPYQERLNHLVGWVEFMRRYSELLAACWAFDAAGGDGPSTAALEQAWDACAYACWSICEWTAIHSSNIGSNLRSVTIKDRLDSMNTYWLKWDHNDPDAPGWATLSEPDTIACKAMIAAGLSETPWVSGIRDNAFSENIVAVASSSDETVVETIYASSDQRYCLLKPSGDITINLQLNNDNSEPEAPIRVFLCDWDDTEVLFEWAVWSVLNTLVTEPLTVQVPAGRYLIKVSHNTGASCSHRFQIERRYPFAMRLSSITRGFGKALKIYFYVPDTEPKVALSIHKDDEQTPVQFYDSSGDPVATTELAPFTYTADVAGGEEGTVWAFDGWYSAYEYSAPTPHNFCPWVSFHPDQVMAPAELLS